MDGAGEMKQRRSRRDTHHGDNVGRIRPGRTREDALAHATPTGVLCADADRHVGADPVRICGRQRRDDRRVTGRHDARQPVEAEQRRLDADLDAIPLEPRFLESAKIVGIFELPQIVRDATILVVVVRAGIRCHSYEAAQQPKLAFAAHHHMRRSDRPDRRISRLLAHVVDVIVNDGNSRALAEQRRDALTDHDDVPVREFLRGVNENAAPDLDADAGNANRAIASTESATRLFGIAAHRRRGILETSIPVPLRLVGARRRKWNRERQKNADHRAAEERERHPLVVWSAHLSGPPQRSPTNPARLSRGSPPAIDLAPVAAGWRILAPLSGFGRNG